MTHSKRLAVFVIALVVLVLGATPVLAGGWAVVTLDELPTSVVANEPLTIGFVVRQHGNKPMPGLTPTVLARLPSSRETLTVWAAPAGAPGHYVATLTFPTAGAWEWAINDGFVTSDALGIQGQPMPPLTVHSSAAALGAGAPEISLPAPPAPSGNGLPIVVGGASVIGALGALLALWRTRRPAAAAVFLGAIMMGGVGLATAAIPDARSASASPSLLANADRGQALFLAKGCVMCHQHSAVREARRAFRDFQVGPDLTRFSASADHLHRWLKNPAAVRPRTEMPALGLSDEEIEALIAFLNRGAAP